MTRPTRERDVSRLSFFEQRRRVRRVRMIIDLTTDLLHNDSSLTPREARCLVECARKAIADLLPAYAAQFDTMIRPRMEHIIRERWSFDDRLLSHQHELVN